MILTEKNKKFIERVAIDLQKRLQVLEPNIYSSTSLNAFIKGMEFKVELIDYEKCYLKDNIIHLNSKMFYYDNNGNISCKNPADLKILFHEFWHGIMTKILPNNGKRISEQYDESVMTAEELAAQYFSRAMLMPEKYFIQTVVESTGIDGMCNVFLIADKFHVDYSDVIARGNDLNLWNLKG